VSAKAEAVSRGVGRASLDTFLARFGEGSISSQARYDALSRYEELPVRVAIRGGRTWKQDLEKLDLTDLAVGDDDAVEFGLEPSPGARRSGVTNVIAIPSSGLSGARSIRVTTSSRRSRLHLRAPDSSSTFPKASSLTSRSRQASKAAGRRFFRTRWFRSAPGPVRR